MEWHCCSRCHWRGQWQRECSIPSKDLSQISTSAATARIYQAITSTWPSRVYIRQMRHLGSSVKTRQTTETGQTVCFKCNSQWTGRICRHLNSEHSRASRDLTRCTLHHRVHVQVVQYPSASSAVISCLNKCKSIVLMLLVIIKIILFYINIYIYI